MSPEIIMMRIFDRGMYWREKERKALSAGQKYNATCFADRATALEQLYDSLEDEMIQEARQEARSHGTRNSNN